MIFDIRDLLAVGLICLGFFEGILFGWIALPAIIISFFIGRLMFEIREAHLMKKVKSNA